MAQAGGGIAISGLPANLAVLNGTYAPTGGQVAGYPSFSAGPTKHLYRHPELDQWHISSKPFDPATNACVANIPAAGGPVPTGARAWRVDLGSFGNPNWVQYEVTAREVDAAAAAALEAERAAAEAAGAAVAAAQGKRVVRPPSRPPARITSSALHLCRPCALLCIARTLRLAMHSLCLCASAVTPAGGTMASTR